MGMLDLYNDIRRSGVSEIPAAIICLAEAVSGIKTLDGDGFSHGLFMALRELEKQGIGIPLDVNHFTEGEHGCGLSGVVDVNICNSPTEPVYIENMGDQS